MRITRFEFNQLHDFRPNANHFSFAEIVEELAEEKIHTPEKPTFSEEQLETAKAAARKEGYNAGYEEASASLTQTLLQRENDVKHALEIMSEQIVQASKGYNDIIQTQSVDVHRFVMAIARKVTGETLSQKPSLGVHELINQCMPILVQKPRLILEANTALVEILNERLKPMLDKAGFEGELQFRVNDTLDISDARLEWSGGFAQRDTRALWKEIEEMMSHVSFYEDTNNPPPAQE